MMIGEVLRRHRPTVQIPNWEPYEPDPSPYSTTTNSHYYNSNTIQIPNSAINPDYSTPITSSDYSPSSIAADYAAALHYRHTPSDYSPSSITTDYAAALHHHHSPSSPRSTTSSSEYDSFPSDSFRIYEFKVRRCVRGRSHDWTECPFAHPGEKARRRDPRRIHYSGTPCPDFRKGSCRKGDSCEFAHGVFECWLHPQRYRTQPCKDGIHCSRRVCFFAHTPEQLRIFGDEISPSTPVECKKKMSFMTDQSSPVSSPGNGYGGFESVTVNELVGCMNGLHLQQMGVCGGGGGLSTTVVSPPRWGFQLSSGGLVNGFGSSQTGSGPGNTSSLPSTPTRSGPVSRVGLFDNTTPWSNLEEEPEMERVESGRDIRARMYAKLRNDNSFDRPESPFCPVPDFGWVSELVK